MSRFRRNGDPLQRCDPADAKDLVDLAARMGIPPDDAVRQVERLISEAGTGRPGRRPRIGRAAPLIRCPVPRRLGHRDIVQLRVSFAHYRGVCE